MITDKDTNFLYLADSLKVEKYRPFLKSFLATLDREKVPYDFLPRTRDIWCRDYMPIQVAEDRFIEYRYDPDYLQAKKYRNSKSYPDIICNEFGLKTVKTDIILDGGNVIRSNNAVILTEKAIIENKDHYKKPQLEDSLKSLFEVDKIIWIPWLERKIDYLGHADGVLRFLDDKTIIVNDYSREKNSRKQLFQILENEGLVPIPLPYNPYDNDNDEQANGIYVNYLQIGNKVFMPTFGDRFKRENKDAQRILKQYFTVIPIESSLIAEGGGILNCITWNILKR